GPGPRLFTSLTRVRLPLGTPLSEARSARSIPALVTSPDSLRFVHRRRDSLRGDRLRLRTRRRSLHAWVTSGACDGAGMGRRGCTIYVQFGCFLPAIDTDD